MIRTRGFTLIELLVVIAIIGILSSVVLASLNTARVKARDTARIAELNQVRSALELYFTTNGVYPGATFGSYASTRDSQSGSSGDCGYQNNWCNFETALQPYINKLPRDNAGGSTLNRRYNYKSDAPYQMYGLEVTLEAANSVSSGDGGYYPDRYEVGQLPSYCKNKYSSNNYWDNWDGANLCGAGN